MSFVECKPIGVLIMKDNGLFDEKIIAVPLNDPFYSPYDNITDIPSHIMDEIKHFFTVYKTLENKSTSVDVFLNREEAIKIIEASLERYRHQIEPRVIAERKARGY
jgi:inorganic pyrophosphatase